MEINFSRSSYRYRFFSLNRHRREISFSPHNSQRTVANADTMNFAKTTVHHSTTDMHQHQNNNNTNNNTRTRTHQHATTWQTVFQRHILTQVNTTQLQRRYTPTLFQVARVLRRYSLTVVPSEFPAKQRKGHGPCALALRGQKEDQ